MAYVDTLGAANRGLAQGALDFNTFMQSTANVNELLSNSQEQALLQQMPIAGVTVPSSVAAPPVPQLPGKGVGLLPAPLQWTPTDTSPAGVAAMYGGINAPGLAPNLSPQFNPYNNGATPLSGPIPQKPGVGANWAMPSKDYYPDAQPFAVGPQNTPLQNLGAGLGNSFYNAPGNVANISANVIERPFVNLWQYLTTPEGELSGVDPTQPSDNVVMGPALTTPGAGVDAPSPASGASSQTGTTVGTPGLPGGGTGTAPSSTEEFFPTEVRNSLLTGDVGELGYIQQQLMRQREEITRSTNEALALVQQKADRLTQYARIAQQSGNVGRMRDYLDQSDALQAEMLAAQQTAREAYLANDLQLWTQQAFQAEFEFRNMGDPTRLSQMMAAYGYPIAIEDAGNGLYNIIDITGDGQGQRRKGSFNSQEISDMFMSLLSEEFRRMKAGLEAERSGKLFDHALDMQMEDMKGANAISLEQAKSLLNGGEYVTQADGNGNLVMTPKQPGSGKPIYIINSEPEVNPDGVPYGRVTRETY